MDSRIESIVIVGAEIVGWSVAAALKRRLPYLTVTVVPTPSASRDLANSLIGTLPSIVGFHEDIGLTEADTVARAASGIRLGTRFVGWVVGEEPFLHTYGSHGQSINGIPFHQLWLAGRQQGLTDPFDRFSLQATLGQADRIAPPESDPGRALQYGLQLDRELYLGMMTAYGQHLGVRSVVPAFADGVVREDGFIQAVSLEDGRQLEADLFVDCSGPAAVLRSRLGADFQDWSRWLPCDRVIVAEGPPPAELHALDEVVAVGGGWTWATASPRKASVGMAYSSRHVAPDAAQRQLSDAGGSSAETFEIRQGRRVEPWLRNCVAVGDASVTVEPLEWTNLHLVHSAVDRIIAMMPGRDCHPVELSEYNRQCSDEAARIRDFLCLHYVTSRRSEPFWAAARDLEPPKSLAHSLALFRDRGRLPFYEEETFSRDSWLALLFGHAVYPRRIDPLAEAAPPELVRSAISRFRDMIVKTVPAQPSLQAYLRSHFEQAIR